VTANISNDAGHLQEFFSGFLRSSGTPLRWCVKSILFCPYRSSCRPNLPGLFTIIDSVLPTKHLCSHVEP